MGIDSFFGSLSPAQRTISNTSEVIIGFREDRAFGTITLLSITGGKLYMAMGSTAQVEKGLTLKLLVPATFYGPHAIFGICEGANSAVVCWQETTVAEGVDLP